MLFGAGASLLTDYRISLVKLIPIEMHESLDYLLGAFMTCATFVFGFWSGAPLVSAFMA